jgi:hypothetical protein
MKKPVFKVFAAMALLWLLAAMAYAQVPASPPYISPPVTPLRVEVPPPPPAAESAIPDPRTPMVTVPEGGPLPTEPPPPRNPIPDPVIQTEAPGVSEVPIQEIGLISDPIVNVAGLTSAANPPDTVGDIGREHFVQMVNATFFQIFDKQGNALTGAMNFGTLWPVGQVCRSNAGDPIAVYDHLADRWLLSQFARPNHMCVAISQTPDPTAGTWFLYTFNTVNFPDYPKFGVWPNGYYMSSYDCNPFTGAVLTCPGLLGVYVFDRTNMLLGFAAGFFKTTIPALGAAGVRDTRILPGDLDGPTPPGGGPPNFFVRTVDGQQNPANPIDRIEVYEALPNWVMLTFSFTLVNTLFPAPFQTMLCNRNGLLDVRDCIPQPTVATNTVDALSNRPMMQLKYRNFGAFEAIVFNQTIDVSGSIPFVLGFTPAEEVAGVRWYELRKSGVNWAIHQQGTFAPQPLGATAENQLLHRWMGSAAMDKDGNIAVGYSITNSDPNNPVFPGIRYTGRRFNDPLDLLPQGEQVLLNGTNAQTQGLGARWGDYSALSVDPIDDCTFWYTNHVAGISGTGPRPTRIGSFSFDTCDGVIVHVGYLDNEHGTRNPALTPTPFDSDANTILISTGGVATLHDTGVIRFENRTKATVTIDPGLQVTTEQAVFQLWDSFLPITLAPGQNLVLAETENFNFDTSDFGLAIDPVVSGSVNGLAFSFTDHARVLLGREDSGTKVPASNETTPYQELGRIAVQVTATAMK